MKQKKRRYNNQPVGEITIYLGSRVIVSQWVDLVDLDDVDLGQDKAGRLGKYLHNTIYQEWVRAPAHAERLPVQIPGKVTLGKYARP